MLQIFDKNFFVTVTYPDMVNNRWTTRKMYPGDRTATPYHLDPNTGLPADYINCKVNIIACGAGGSTKLIDHSTGKITRHFNYKFPYEYISRYEKMPAYKPQLEEFLSQL